MGYSDTSINFNDDYIRGALMWSQFTPRPTLPAIEEAPLEPEPEELPFSLTDHAIATLERAFYSNFGKENPIAFNERIELLDQLQYDLDIHMPNNALQSTLDDLGAYIQDKFSFLETYTTWLQESPQGEWYTQLALLLIKLSLRAAHNIIDLLYRVIEGIVFTTIHPCKSLCTIAKQILLLCEALSHPETYTKIGAGIIGSGLGYAMFPSNPIPLIAMIIGGTCIFAGISIGALKTAIEAQEGETLSATWNNITTQITSIPESLLTGFFMGLGVGGIAHACTPTPPYDDGFMHTWKGPVYSREIAP